MSTQIQTNPDVRWVNLARTQAECAHGFPVRLKPGARGDSPHDYEPDVDDGVRDE